MPDEVPDLRPGILHKLVDALAHRIKGHDKCEAHCKCVERMRVKVGVLWLLFVGALVAIVRREVMSYVPRVPDAPPPIQSGQRMPGIDPAKP